MAIHYRLDQKYRSSTWRPEWGRCPKNGKRSYPSRHEARTACRSIGVGDIYRCGSCRHYHLTHYPANVARAITYLLESLREDRRKHIAKKKNAHLQDPDS